MKPVTFLGDSLAQLRDFPVSAPSEAGYQLSQVQKDNEPADWKPLGMAGKGAREIRVHEESGAFRVIYLATVFDRVLVLHAFQKKTQQTAQRDVELATARLKAWKA